MKIALSEKIALLLHRHVDVLCSSPSLAMADEPGKRHDVRAHEAEVVGDWLNPLSLGIMSASVYTENLA